MIAALLLGAAVPAGFPAAEPATISRIHADPGHWNGQWVRVQGWVARCQPLDCALAEGPNGNGLRLSFEAAESFDKWVQPMLPAHVEVTARIDSSCLLGLCTDRAPALRRVYVEPLAPQFTSPSKDK